MPGPQQIFFVFGMFNNTKRQININVLIEPRRVGSVDRSPSTLFPPPTLSSPPSPLPYTHHHHHDHDCSKPPYDFASGGQRGPLVLLTDGGYQARPSALSKGGLEPEQEVQKQTPDCSSDAGVGFGVTL